MKKLWILLSVLLVVGLLVGCQKPAPAPAPAPKPAPAPAPAPAPTPTPTPTPAPAIKLKFASLFAAPPSENSEEARYFLDEVTKRSNGRITFETYWGGSLFGRNEQLFSAKEGIADVIMFIQAYHPAEFPLNQAAWYFFFNPDDWGLALEAHKAAMKSVPQVEEEFTRQNLKLLSFAGPLSYVLNTTTPVTNLTQLKGKKLGVVAGSLATFAEAGGAVPVVMGATDRYVALERSTIDGHLLSSDLITSMKHAEVAKNIAKFPPPPLGGAGPGRLMAVNLKAWDKLSAADKKLFEDVGAATEKYWIQYLKDWDKRIADNFAKAGVTIRDFDAKDYEAWLAKTPNIAGIWAKDMEAKGLPGQKVMNAYLDVYGKAGLKFPPGWGKAQ